jgi:ribosomal protein S18 acetylase RimI-like enzyme
MGNRAVNFTALNESEIPALRQMAHDIWHAHYPGIITTAQIDYMLQRMFAPDVLRAELSGKVQWEFSWHEGRRVGFLSLLPEANTHRLKLSKLYLLPEFHGRGLGQEMLARVKTCARTAGARQVHLTVNKQNAIAIRAYQKAGFQITGEMVADIGGGYVMDDFLMAWEVS